MSYGLYDGDLILYPRIPFFNLELMKLSTYYKRKKEIVVFSEQFKPQMYSHFIIRQDYPSYNLYTSAYNNIELGGRAFDGDKYKPLDLAIENCKPDTHLYDKFEYKAGGRTMRSNFSVMRRAEHVRLSLDGKTINKQWESQLRKDKTCHGLILHDYDVGAIEGAYELFRDHLIEIVPQRDSARLGMKFPLQTNTEQEFLKWFKFLNLNNYYNMQFNGILTTNNIEEIIESSRRMTASQTQLYITSNISYEDFITTGVVQLYKTLLDLRRHGIVFSLIYDKDFFIDEQWFQVVKLIDRFNKYNSYEMSPDFVQRRAPYFTMYSYVKLLTRKYEYEKPIVPPEELRELFNFLREQNYELFKMFYEYTGELK